MLTYFKLAWRNIWRNKRRTLITAASVFFAIVFALIMRGMQLGSYDKMVYNIVHAYTGYIQVHAKGYWDDVSLNNSLAVNDELISSISRVEGVTAVVPRLESFALASYETQTKGVMVVGIDPVRENNITGIKGKIVKGSYLEPATEGALVAGKLATFLKIGVGDTLVLLSGGFQGATAAAKFRVAGILHFPSPDLDNRMVYLPLKACQDFYSASGRLTSIVINIQNPDDLQQITKSIKELPITAGMEVMPWNEMLVEIDQSIKADNASGIIMLALLYMIIGFGILGTVLMMTAERVREFGVMIAIGMKRIRLAAIVVLEMVQIGFIGLAAGILFSIPILYYYYLHPYYLKGEMAKSIEEYGLEAVMPIAWEASYFISQSLVVVVIVFIATLFPVIGVFRLKIVNALKK